MSFREMTDAEIERLLRGETSDEALLPLARMMTEVRRLGDMVPLRGSEMAMQAAALVRDQRPVPTRRPVSTSRRPRRRLSRVLAIPALAMILLIGTTGLAFASDSSAPGDALYGIDRALELVGIGTGGVQERIAEAEKLALDGDAEAALEHVGNAMNETDNEEAGEALLETAERLRSNPNGSENANLVRDELADMLEWMATTSETGSAFGQGVADRARDLGKGNDDPGPPDGVAPQGEGNNGKGNGPPQDRPGQGPAGE